MLSRETIIEVINKYIIMVLNRDGTFNILLTLLRFLAPIIAPRHRVSLMT